MSTVIRFEEEEKLTGSGAETPRAVTKREHAPAARQRHQLLVEKGEHQPYLAMRSFHVFRIPFPWKWEPIFN